MLDADLLAENHCLFGGGTAIALRYGEYRESVDIDFLVSDIDGYRQLRQLLTGEQGLSALARKGAKIQQTGELRADQYGIRSMVRVGDVDIKFEIVLEARIELDIPGEQDRIGDIAALTALDMAASKLLANSDRWADDSDLAKAVNALLTRHGRMDRCMAVLQMTPAVTPALLRQRIKALLPRVPSARGKAANL
ncbi:nucleotidyl transferase AbiEii/AbiGii toxin family protein [Variovorax beijingensis]|nr:nucleotidyl transferase AbiEii/AbiGii toxin family protein [Variovorax beijingensis]